jgi:hypothetical protein
MHTFHVLGAPPEFNKVAQWLELSERSLGSVEHELCCS